VILAKTIKGWTLGPSRSRAQRDPPDQEDERRAAARAARPPAPARRDPRRGARRARAALLPPRRGLRVHVHDARAHGAHGRLAPEASVTVRRALELPDDAVVRRAAQGSGTQPVSRRPWPSRAAAQPHPRRGDRPASCRSSPTRPARSAWTRCSASSKIYASQGQKYEPVDHDLLLNYKESTDGQILEEGITEAGAMASLHRGGDELRHPRRADGPVLHLLLDVRVPARRRPDLGRGRRPRPRLPHRRHGRAHHLLGEGLQHQDGHSLLLASTVPVCRAYDPAFAYEVATIVEPRHRPPCTAATTSRTSSTTSRSTTRTTRCRLAPTGRPTSGVA
jgi:pyruvate dehydrogenase E1 component